VVEFMTFNFSMQAIDQVRRIGSRRRNMSTIGIVELGDLVIILSSPPYNAKSISTATMTTTR